MNAIEFARNLFLIRREHNMTIDDLAAALGVSEELICEWECAKTSPSLDQMNRLAKVYGIPLDDLIRTPKPHAEPEELPEIRLEEPAPEPSETETAETEEIPEETKEKAMPWWEILVIVLLILIIGAGVFFLVRPEWFPFRDFFGGMSILPRFLK